MESVHWTFLIIILTLLITIFVGKSVWYLVAGIIFAIFILVFDKSSKNK